LELKDVLALLPKSTAGWVVFGVVFLVFLTAVIAVIRALTGHKVKIFWFEFGSDNADHSACVQRTNDLQVLINKLSDDSQTKRNVIDALRELLHEVHPFVRRDGAPSEADIKSFVNRALVCVATVVSKGAQDRHRAAVWIRDGNLPQFKMYEGLRFRREAISDARFAEDSLVGWVFSRGASYNCEDVALDKNFEAKPKATSAFSSVLCVPIRNIAGHTVAVLAIDAKAPRYFEQDHVFYVEAIAELIGIVLR
jgi:GAF domain-containing protein